MASPMKEPDATVRQEPWLWRGAATTFLVGIFGAIIQFLDAAKKFDEWSGIQTAPAVITWLCVLGNAVADFLPWNAIFILLITSGTLFLLVKCIARLSTLYLWFKTVRLRTASLMLKTQTEVERQQIDLLKAIQQREFFSQSLRVKPIMPIKAEVEPNSRAESSEEETLLKSGWIHIDQSAARKAAPQYHDSMEMMPKLLRMDADELTERLRGLGANVPRLIVDFFLKHPSVIPKPDLWPKLCNALLLQDDHFEKGRRFQYPKKWSVERLKRYHSQERAFVWTFAPGLTDLSNLDALDSNRIRRTVTRVEMALWAETQNGGFEQ
jgi:hypothetical protein